MLEVESPQFAAAFFNNNQGSGSGIRKPSARLRFLSVTAGLLLAAPLWKSLNAQILASLRLLMKCFTPAWLRCRSSEE
jgi:Flp pilus assembly protein TadB